MAGAPDALLIYTDTKGEPPMNQKKTSKNTGVGVGIALGAGVGASLGLILLNGNIALGAGIGVALGIVFGAILDYQNNKMKEL
jgi:uncharacterized membrane protein